MRTVAVVLTLDRFGQREECVLRSVVAEARSQGANVVAVAYGSADAAAVRACAETHGVAVVEAEANAAFGAAANAGARVAGGDVLAFVDGAEPASPAGWLGPLLAVLEAREAGVAGPRITIDGAANDECGLILCSSVQAPRGFTFQGLTGVRVRIPCDALPSDCLVTKRSLFEELGGFAESFGSVLESIDYCLRAAESGCDVYVVPSVTFARRLLPSDLENGRPDRQRAFDDRWRGRAEAHENFWPELTGSIVRSEFRRDGVVAGRVPIPRVDVLLHGAPPDEGFTARLGASRMEPATVTWAAEPDAVRAARELTEVRGSGYVAFVRTDTKLARDWLNELVNAIERAPDTAAATSADPPDARCTLVRPRLIPQHLRIEAGGSFDDSVAAWLRAAAGAGRTVERLRRTATVVGPAAPGVRAGTGAPSVAADPFVSIVMLSWNAPEYTEGAIDSIRAHTRLPYEIIIVDNGSGPETIARLQNIPDIRVIYNAVNTGFPFGCNQGLAAARGTHVVLLNNDVIVTAGWLEALVAVQQEHPAVGCSAPRSNQIAGLQKLAVPYRDLADLPAFAAQRALEQRGRWTNEPRVTGFCMCLNRHVVAEIGGLDPSFGTGNFEDDDYCIRIRAAGYDIAVCEDSFIHHFGNVTFSINGVDYYGNHARNLELFAQKWNLQIVDGLFAGDLPYRSGFVRERDYVPLPPPTGVGPDWVSGRG